MSEGLIHVRKKHAYNNISSGERLKSCRVPTSIAVLVERKPAVLSSIRQLLAINSLLELSFIVLLIICLLVCTKFF